MITTIILYILAAIAGIFAYIRNLHFEGLKTGYLQFIKVLPLLIASFGLAGFIQVLIPKEIILQWLGKEAGYKGILIAWACGYIMPGGPSILFPVLSGFLQLGASMYCIVTLVVAWGIGTLIRLPIEISILGSRFVGIRLLSSFFLPPIAGLVAKLLTK